MLTVTENLHLYVFPASDVFLDQAVARTERAFSLRSTSEKSIPKSRSQVSSGRVQICWKNKRTPLSRERHANPYRPRRRWPLSERDTQCCLLGSQGSWDPGPAHYTRESAELRSVCSNTPWRIAETQQLINCLSAHGAILSPSTERVNDSRQYLVTQRSN